MDDQAMNDHLDDLFGENPDLDAVTNTDGDNVDLALHMDLSNSAMDLANTMHVNANNLFSHIPMAAPPSAALLQRIAQTHRSGCTQKIAWAKSSSIVRISSNGKKITFHTMLRNPKDGTYALSREGPYPIEAEDGRSFMHIEFSGLGLDLAVFDEWGKLQIFVITPTLGRMTRAHVEGSEEVGDLGVVVGCHWLPVYPLQSKVPWIAPVVKENGQWRTHMAHRDQHAPVVHHVVDGRGALLHVNRLHALKLAYQHEGQAWREISLDLERLDGSNDLLSHAAFGEDGDRLLLVTHSLRAHMRVYTVRIHWNPSQIPRQNGPPSVTVAPTMEIGHMSVQGNVQPQPIAFSENTFGGDEQLQHQTDGAVLSDLRIVPAIPEYAGPPQQTYHTILAVFTHVPNYSTGAHRETFSVLARWEVHDEVPTLHEAFSKLRSSGESRERLPATTALKRQPDIYTPTAVLNVEIQYFNTAVAFMASDGSVDFRDREYWSTIHGSTDDEETTASSLSDNGFSFPPLHANLQMALSPDNAAAVVILEDDNEMHVQPATFGYNFLTGDTDGKHQADLNEPAIVALARQYAIACSSTGASDQLLALILPKLDRHLRYLFVHMTLKCVNRNADLSMQDNKMQTGTVLKDTLPLRVISANLVLGHQDGHTGTHNISYKLAWAAINLRAICLALAQTVNPKDTVRADVLHSLHGPIHWVLDLIVLILNDLFTLMREAGHLTTDLVAFTAHLQKLNSASLHLLLSSFPRVLLRFFTSWVVRYIQAAVTAAKRARNLTDTQQMKDIVQMYSNLPFKLQLEYKMQVVEHLIKDVDEAVRRAYASSKYDDAARSSMERGMLIEGALPQTLLPVVDHLLHRTLPKISDAIDQSRVYFANTAWLGLSDAAPEAGRKYDVIKKTLLPKGGKLRLCRRCGSFAEEIAMEKLRDAAPWFLTAQRHCICGNYWTSA